MREPRQTYEKDDLGVWDFRKGDHKLDVTDEEKTKNTAPVQEA
jgi:hypothetical protein